MSVELFLTLLVISASATSIAIQILKNILDNAGATYKSVPIAVIVAAIVGIAEIFIYYTAVNGGITYSTLIYALCMGVANAVGATTEYDLVKKFIMALFAQPSQ